MSASNALETAILLHFFNNSNIADIGDATGLRGSTTVGSLYVQLHTADPGEAGTQSTSEAGYTSYARVPTARTAGVWVVSGNQASNVSAITFPACTGGSSTVTYASVGALSSGAGLVIVSGALTPTLVVVAPIQPILAAGTGFVTSVD